MAAVALTAQHRSPGTLPQIPSRSSVSQLTTDTSPRGPGRSVTARGDPAVGSSQAPSQKSLSLLPKLGSCPQEALGSWERGVGDPR